MTLQLYYFPTPNGKKVTIALEEMGLPYEVRIVNILSGEQNAPDFQAISLNGRIPALVDGAVTIFESGAILQYLARLSGRFGGEGIAQRAQVESWLMWQMAGFGPMIGQLAYFTRAAAKPDRDPAEIGYPLHRYRKEVARLCRVLDRQLEGREHICGDYSIADMACWPWVDQYHHLLGLSDVPFVAQWHTTIANRPAVERAKSVGKGEAAAMAIKRDR